MRGNCKGACKEGVFPCGDMAEGWGGEFGGAGGGGYLRRKGGLKGKGGWWGVWRDTAWPGKRVRSKVLGRGRRGVQMGDGKGCMLGEGWLAFWAWLGPGAECGLRVGLFGIEKEGGGHSKVGRRRCRQELQVPVGDKMYSPSCYVSLTAEP